jgi:hypothetical protein
MGLSRRLTRFREPFAQLARFLGLRLNESNRSVGLFASSSRRFTMNVNELIGPAVVAAAVSGFVTILGNVFSIRSSRSINSEKIASEKDLAERKFGFEADLAERKFRYEKALHDYRRRVEFAEELLASFYKLKDIIRSIRGPFSFGNEGESRKRREFENEAEARSRDGFYVPIVRIQKSSDFLSDLTSKKYRAQAVYQNEIHRAFELAVEVLNAIQLSSSMLVEQVGQPRVDPEFWRKLERDIWDTSSPDKPDELSQKILQSIDIVEKAVQPTLAKSLVGS